MQIPIVNFLKQIPIAIWTLVFIFLPTIYIIIWVAPSNMDEFLAYHTIACTEYAAAIEHTFIEGCSWYPSKIFDIEFHRNYGYVGVSSAYLYQPFFNALPSPLSHYILGLLVLLAFSIALTKVMQLNPAVALVPLLYFPLAFQTIHDTGPIRISLLTYPVFIYLAFVLLKAKSLVSAKVLALVILFFSVAIAAESKPFFLYLLPQILLIAFGYAYAISYPKEHDGHSLRSLIFQVGSKKTLTWLIFIALVIAFALYLTLFSIKMPGSSGADTTYFSYLLNSATTTNSTLDEAKMILDYLVFPFMFTHKIYDVNRLQQIISAIFFLPIFNITFHYLKQKTQAGLFLGASILVMIFILLATKNAWAGHHFIFIHIPLIMLVMLYANESKARFIWAIRAIVLLALVCSAQLLNGTVTLHSNSEKSVVFRYLHNEEIAKSSIINFSSWGGYYIQSLYGAKSQLVTYQFLNEANHNDEANNMIQAQRLLDLSKKLNREIIYNICYSCSKKDMMKFFPGKMIEKLELDNSAWLIWKIS